MWRDILKMPIVDELEEDDTFDRFLGGGITSLPQTVSSHAYEWESKDGNARAKYSLLIYPRENNQHIPVWYNDVFEIARDSRGLGKSREYLKELVADIRENESNLDIDEIIRLNPEIKTMILDNWDFFNEETQSWDYPKFLETPYKIVGKGLPDTIGFWDKMIDEGIVDGYL